MHPDLPPKRVGVASLGGWDQDEDERACDHAHDGGHLVGWEHKLGPQAPGASSLGRAPRGLPLGCPGEEEDGWTENAQIAG